MRRWLLAAAAALATIAPGLSAAADPAQEAVHVVASGETLNGIANRAGVSATAIAKANALKPPYVVRIGQKLQIPRDAPTRDGPKKDASKVTAARTPAPATLAPAPALTPSAAGAGVLAGQESVHMVQPGETLGGIAARAKVPRVLIAEANGLAPPYVVKVGQKLQIPRTRRHAVTAGDTGFSISMKYGVPWEQIALANSLDPAVPIRSGETLLIPTLLNPPPAAVSKLDPPPQPAPQPSASAPAPRFAWPVSGPIRRAYATGSDYHDGVDITAPKGTMVRAAAPGTVRFADKEKEQFGNLVVIDHGEGWYTAYGFLSRITVKEGAKVAAGERIGLVGNTGLAKGNELHFEVRRDGKPIDPLDELPKAP